jgi:hypothetical protein
MAVLTVVWLGLNVIFPGIAPTGIPTIVSRSLVDGAILTGLGLGLSRTGLEGGARLATWLAIAVPFTLWLAIAWTLALDGAFRPVPGSGRVPPLPIAIFAPILVGLVLLTRSKRVAAVLDATPPAWLIGLQLYRVLGGIFLVYWARGAAPGVFALPAGIGDVLTGLLALPVALLVSAGTSGGRRAAIAWNLLGIADLTLAVTLGTLSGPGPLQIFSLDRPNLLVGTYPTVMVPAFAVPSSVILHGLSLWQLRRLARRTAPSSAPALPDRAMPA